MMTDDMELVRDYARSHSEEAFATLVSRHINLVYSVALRQARDAHLAEEVTQVVFVILARKAGALSPKTIISGWLCRTARNVSARALTMRQRRQNREQEAYMQSILNEPESESAAWTQIAPLLEAALGQLGGKDHDAVVLRFFEGKSFKEVGAAIGTSEDTAKKRVTRTLEKLRRFFLKRGVALSTAVIAGAVTANSVQAAPETLAKSVTAVALTKGAALGGSTLTLIKGALKIMAWTKMKTTVVIGVAVLLAAGTAPVIVQHISRYREKVRDDAVWSHITKMDSQQLRTAPPAVSIRPAQFGPKAGSGWLGVNKKQLGAAKSVAKILQNAYGIREARIIASTPLPSGQYDYIVTLPDHQEEALQAVVKEKFGLVGKKEMREAMKKETWFTGEEACDFGLADETSEEDCNNALRGLAVNNFKPSPAVMN